MDARLLKSQRVEVFDVIKSRDVDPLMFSWGEGVWYSNEISVLQFPEEYFYFEFGYNPNLVNYRYGGKRAPGSEQREVTYEATTWKAVLMQVSNWVNAVKKEL